MAEQPQATVESGTSPASQSAEDRVANLLFGAEEPEQQQAEPAEETAAEQPEQQAGEQPAEPIEDSEEIDFEGEKYIVPKKLKEAFLRQSDYTQKTQEAANLRRLAEQERSVLQISAELSKRTLPIEAEIRAIDKQLEEAKGIDWSNLDTDKMVRARYAIDQLKHNAPIWKKEYFSNDPA